MAPSLHRSMGTSPLLVVAVLSIGCLVAGCPADKKRQVVTIFHAASLAGCLGRAQEKLAASHPELELRLEPSGSQTAARKVSELGRRADLVLSADWFVLQDMLIAPGHALWLIRFASNEMVLVHGEHSRFTEEISADNWSEVLLRDKVRLGRADENTAPAGFLSLMVWQLAGGHELAKKLTQKCEARHVVPDVSELISLLQARAIDYAFVFRSLAEEHNLKMVRLPPQINMGDPHQAQAYGRARVSTKLGKVRQLYGRPIEYALAIPKNAPNPEGAQQFAAFLLGPDGAQILTRSGFNPLRPGRVKDTEGLPVNLRSLVKAIESDQPTAKAPGSKAP